MFPTARVPLFDAVPNYLLSSRVRTRISNTQPPAPQSGIRHQQGRLHALAQLKHWRIKQEVCLISRRKVRGGEEKHWGLEKACVESFSNDLQLGLGSCFAGGTTASLSMLQSPIHQKACLFRKRKKRRQLQPLSEASHQTTSRNGTTPMARQRLRRNPEPNSALRFGLLSCRSSM
jgi:hypothetical protein